MDSQQYGSWAFIVGVVIAIISGIAQAAAANVPGAEFIPLVLVILGAIVGFLNISDREITDFLVAAIALLAVGFSAAGLNIIPVIGAYLVAVVNNIAVFVAPAVLVVALKAVNNHAKSA